MNRMKKKRTKKEKKKKKTSFLSRVRVTSVTWALLLLPFQEKKDFSRALSLFPRDSTFLPLVLLRYRNLAVSQLLVSKRREPLPSNQHLEGFDHLLFLLRLPSLHVQRPRELPPLFALLLLHLSLNGLLGEEAEPLSNRDIELLVYLTKHLLMDKPEVEEQPQLFFVLVLLFPLLPRRKRQRRL